MMRQSFLLIALSFLLIGAVCCATTGKSAVGKSIQEGSETRLYEVLGMNCPGCHGGLEKLVKKIPAVLEAKANWKKKQLLVTLREGAELNDEDVYDAIRRANFTVGKRIN
jgi:copper chaperone CopZ